MVHFSPFPHFLLAAVLLNFSNRPTIVRLKARLKTSPLYCSCVDGLYGRDDDGDEDDCLYTILRQHRR